MGREESVNISPVFLIMIKLQKEVMPTIKALSAGSV